MSMIYKNIIATYIIIIDSIQNFYINYDIIMIDSIQNYYIDGISYYYHDWYFILIYINDIQKYNCYVYYIIDSIQNFYIIVLS